MIKYKDIFTRILLFLSLFLLVGRQSQAAFILSFNSSGTNQSFSVESGGLVTVPIYLVQTSGEDRLNSIGLYSAGASLYHSFGSGAAGNSSVSSASLAPHWTDIGSNLVDNRPNLVILEGVIDDPGQPVFATSNAVLLGSVQFIGGAVGNVTSLQLSLDEVTPFWNNLVDAQDASPTVFRSGSIATTSAVPEPSSIVSATVLLAAGIVARARKRKRLTTPTSA